jgi:hypothetical protein
MRIFLRDVVSLIIVCQTKVNSRNVATVYVCIIV